MFVNIRFLLYKNIILYIKHVQTILKGFISCVKHYQYFETISTYVIRKHNLTNLKKFMRLTNSTILAIASVNFVKLLFERVILIPIMMVEEYALKYYASSAAYSQILFLSVNTIMFLFPQRYGL